MRFPRLWPRRGTSSSSSGLAPEAGDPISPLQHAGQLLKERREQRGLSMRELSREIRITTPVLEALERGWSDRLPEAAYLGTMLTQLETHLELEPGSLHGALPAGKASRMQGQTSGNRRFTLGSIDILSTWQGSVVYAAVILGTLMALNQQQRYLALRNSEQLKPIPPSAEDLQISSPQSALNPGIHGLRPLEDSRRKPLKHWLPAEADGNAASASPVPAIGLLQLRLSQPSTITLSSAGGDRSELTGSTGELTLQLQSPVSLKVTPPPKEEDQVLWDGLPQTALNGQAGSFRLPQKEPRSP